MARITRRDVLRTVAAAAVALPMPAIAQQASARVVVIGGGFGGTSCARALRKLGTRIQVTLVEPNTTYTACPMSNMIIAGFGAQARQFSYDKVAADGIAMVHQMAIAVDPSSRTVRLADGSTLSYDRLVLSPGIDLRFDALKGYDEAAAEKMPHAWKAGEQTLLLRKQLDAMDDGGVVALSVPANPYRCPPGPYERASLIAQYLKDNNKRRSKLLILDAKDTFSKQRLFQNAWKELYPGLIEWVSLSQGGAVTSVDASTNTLVTDFAKYKVQVANVIPPQRAGRIAQIAGVTDKSGWCPIDPVTCESKQVQNIHVIGDSCIGGSMPKSAFAANAQAKVCAEAIFALISGGTPQSPKLINTCYSLVATSYGISIAGVYKPKNGLWIDVPGAGGTSPLDADSIRAEEALLAMQWFVIMTDEVFG